MKTQQTYRVTLSSSAGLHLGACCSTRYVLADSISQALSLVRDSTPGPEQQVISITLSYPRIELNQDTLARALDDWCSRENLLPDDFPGLGEPEGPRWIAEVARALRASDLMPLLASAMLQDVESSLEYICLDKTRFHARYRAHRSAPEKIDVDPALPGMAGLLALAQTLLDHANAIR